MMMDNDEIRATKLDCYRATGNIADAKALYEWVTATPASAPLIDVTNTRLVRPADIARGHQYREANIGGESQTGQSTAPPKAPDQDHLPIEAVRESGEVDLRALALPSGETVSARHEGWLAAERGDALSLDASADFAEGYNYFYEVNHRAVRPAILSQTDQSESGSVGLVHSTDAPLVIDPEAGWQASFQGALAQGHDEDGAREVADFYWSSPAEVAEQRDAARATLQVVSDQPEGETHTDDVEPTSILNDPDLKASVERAEARLEFNDVFRPFSRKMQGAE